MEDKKQSISETLEKHTMEVMKKIESQIPLHIKSFSDFSREYMRFLERYYEINCMLENAMFGNMGLDEKSVKLLDEYLENSTKFYTSQLDVSNEYFKSYLTTRLTVMESYNKFLKEFSANLTEKGKT